MGCKELIDFCKKNKRLYCYGAGRYGKVVHQFLSEQNIQLEGFLVTTLDEKNQCSDLPIKSIRDMFPLDDDTGIIISVRDAYHAEIKSILYSSGVLNYFAITKECFIDIDNNTAYDISLACAKNKVCVLLYHRVCDIPSDIWQLAALPDVFDMHIRFYRENFNIIRFEDDWSKISEPSLVITFDDGYADNYFNALPILEKHQVPATIFVSTGNLGTDKEFWWDELERIVFSSNKTKYDFFPNNECLTISTYEDKIKACQKIRLFLKGLLPEKRELFLNEMINELGVPTVKRKENRSLSENELRELASSPYITIGGHTVTHNMLSSESLKMQQWEIDESKKRIEKLINRSLTVFAYPFGDRKDINEYSIKCVRNAGYKKAATTLVGLADCESDPFYIPRNTVPLYSDINELRRYVGKIYALQ